MTPEECAGQEFCPTYYQYGTSRCLAMYREGLCPLYRLRGKQRENNHQQNVSVGLGPVVSPSIQAAKGEKQCGRK